MYYTIAKIREPCAIDPKWYLKARYTDLVTGNLEVSYLKYQMHTEEEIINYPKDNIKALNQIPTKML